jgi:hypothetical protein
LIHFTLDDSFAMCSSAVASHTFEITLPPQVPEHKLSPSVQAIELHTQVLVQDFDDVRATAALKNNDVSQFCPRERPAETADANASPAAKGRGLVMFECSRAVLGEDLCFPTHSSSNDSLHCKASSEVPGSELYLGVSLGINNNDEVDSNELQVAALRQMGDVDLLFKFRAPQLPQFMNKRQATQSQTSLKHSDYFMMYAATLIRGGVASDVQGAWSNLATLPAGAPLLLPSMTLTLADYAQDDIRAFQSNDPSSNTLW